MSEDAAATLVVALGMFAITGFSLALGWAGLAASIGLVCMLLMIHIRVTDSQRRLADKVEQLLAAGGIAQPTGGRSTINVVEPGAGVGGVSGAAMGGTTRSTQKPPTGFLRPVVDGDGP